MPEVSNDTVMSEPDTMELVAVRVIDDPAFSAILDALAANVIVGAASSSIIVMVFEVRVSSHNSVPLSTAVSVKSIVSFISDIESSINVIEKLPVSPLTVTSSIL